MFLETASRDILYHNTTGYNAFQALKSHSFKLPFSETNSSEKVYSYRDGDKRKEIKREIPYLHYISFARNLSSGYIADRGPHLNAVNNPITFVIDGKKIQSINRRSVFKAVNYYDTDESGRQMGSGKEAEERFYSDKRTIDIRGCIKAVLLVVRGLSANQWDRQVYAYCLKNKIPIKLFTLENKQGFLRQRENKEDREKARQILLETKFSLPSSYNNETTRKYYNSKLPFDQRRLSDYGILEELTRETDFSKLSQRGRELARESSIGYSNSRGISQYFESYIHNLRGGDRNDDTTKIGKLVKKLKAKNLEDFFIKLEKKWTKIYEERTNV